MRKASTTVVLVSIIFASLLPAGAIAALGSDKVPVIVTFKGENDSGLIRAFGGDVKYDYDLISAIACRLPQSAIDALRHNPVISWIEFDERVYMIDGEVLPWGVDRVDAEVVQQTGNKGAGVKVAIIDTGIDYDHPDLDANYVGGYDFVNDDAYPMDDNGHGTHCAGIVAAEDNEEGVIGVAPEVQLFAAKVLDASGSGSLSDVIAGIQWAAANGVQVISMSLGSDYDVVALHDACDAAYEGGVLVVAAAGNDYSRRGKVETDSVDYPGRYSSVIAVGAVDSSDLKASFSSTGSALELAAPGVSVYSTYWNNGYATLSGTSMACPHVAGTAALVFASAIDPAYDTDGDGGWDASEVRGKLRDTADDLGSEGWDNWYGYGLVDADEAAAAPGIDVTPPTISGLTPADGAQVSVASLTISATVADASGINGATIVMSIDGVGVGHTYDGGSGLVSFTTTLEDGYHSVALAVSDTLGNAASASWAFKVDTTAPVQPKVHVAGIVMSTLMRKAGPNTFIWANAQVAVVDADGNSVVGAVVSGHWEGATSDSDSGTTDSYGQVTLSSDSVKKTTSLTFTFVVDSVTLSGWEYDSSSNVESRDSIIG